MFEILQYQYQIKWSWSPSACFNHLWRWVCLHRLTWRGCEHVCKVWSRPLFRLERWVNNIQLGLYPFSLLLNLCTAIHDNNSSEVTGVELYSVIWQWATQEGLPSMGASFGCWYAINACFLGTYYLPIVFLTWHGNGSRHALVCTCANFVCICKNWYNRRRILLALNWCNAQPQLGWRHVWWWSKHGSVTNVGGSLIFRHTWRHCMCKKRLVAKHALGRISTVSAVGHASCHFIRWVSYQLIHAFTWLTFFANIALYGNQIVWAISCESTVQCLWICN